MNDLSKRLILILLFAAAILMPAASHDDLSNDCAGQYLRSTIDNKLYSFDSLGPGGSWNCTRMEDGQKEQLLPEQMVILPIYKDSAPFDVLSYALCSVMPSADAGETQEAELAACREMVGYCQTSPRCMNLLKCLDSIDGVQDELKSILKKHHPRNNDSGNAIIKALQGSKAAQAIQDTAGEADFQIAFACYFRYCHVVRATTAKALLPAFSADTETLLNKLGETLRSSYVSQEAAGRLRVSTFQAIFPDATGPWRNPPPLTIKTMESMAFACNRSFLSTLEFSENADLQRWGSAMLGILRLMPSETLDPQTMARFDQALKRYSDKYHLNP